MSKAYLNIRPVLAGLFGSLLLLALAGCVMPPDWPAIKPVATVSGLEGTYRGDLKQCAQFTVPLFSTQYLSVRDADGLRLTVVPDGLQVEALSGPTVLNTRVVSVQLEQGAVTFEWKSPASSSHYRETLRVNAAGELVIEHHQSSVGIDAYSNTRWWRIPRATQ